MIQTQQQRPWWPPQQPEGMPPPPGTEQAPAQLAAPPPLSRFDMPEPPQPVAMPDMPTPQAAQQQAPVLSAAATPMPDMPGASPGPESTPAPAIAPPPKPFNAGPDMTTADEGSASPPPERDLVQQQKPAQPDVDPRIAYQKEMADAIIKKAREHTPAWRQALAAALTLSPRTKGISPMVLNPPDKMEELAPLINKNAAEALNEKREADTSALRKQQIETSGAEKAGHQDTLVTNAETRRLNAQTAEQKVKELHDAAVRKWVEDKIGKSRMPDATYQKESDNRPPGYEFVPNPQEPGSGWAVPPAWTPMPKELVKHAPGYVENQLAPHSVVTRAMQDYGREQLEITKAAQKPDARVPLEDRIVSEYIAAHPGASLAEARTATQTNQPKPSSESGTWALQEDAEGKPVLFNSKTGETKVAPQGLQKSGTAVKANAAKEKEEGPARMALNYASDYLTNGAFTGSGDEALQEKFFELAKPATGFRMTKAQMDMLQNSRSWMGSAAAHVRHATTGTWFDDGQRKQIVDTMKQLAAAKLKGGATQPQGGGAGSTLFSSNGQTYNIPAAQQAEFLKDHPNAVKQ